MSFLNSLRSFEGRAFFWVCCLLLASLVAAYPQMLAIFQGVKAGTEIGFGLRLLREGILLLVLTDLGLFMLLTRRALFPYLGNLILALAVAAYCAYLTYLTLQKGLPIVVPLSGLRIFQYLPLAVIAYWLARRSGAALLLRTAKFLRVYLLVMVPVSLFQVVYAPPVQGKTVFGSRAFGTFNESNVFGVTVATCALWFVITWLQAEEQEAPQTGLRYPLWIGLCLVLTLLSGSRTALALAFVVAVYPLYLHFRRSIDRTVIAYGAPFVLGAVLFIGSLSAISGRATNLLNDGRLKKWGPALRNIATPEDLFFGWGLGLGSNTLTTVFGRDVYPGQFIPDSHYLFLLGSYGLIGLLLYGFFLATVYLSSPREAALIFIVFVALFGVPFLPFELYPVNLLLFLLWGSLLGLGRYRHERERRPP